MCSVEINPFLAIPRDERNSPEKLHFGQLHPPTTNFISASPVLKTWVSLASHIPCTALHPRGLRLLSSSRPWQLRPLNRLHLQACAPQPLQWLRCLLTMFHPLNIHCELPVNIIFRSTCYIWCLLIHLCPLLLLMSHVSLLITRNGFHLSCGLSI